MWNTWQRPSTVGVQHGFSLGLLEPDPEDWLGFGSARGKGYMHTWERQKWTWHMHRRLLGWCLLGWGVYIREQEKNRSTFRESLQQNFQEDKECEWKRSSGTIITCKKAAAVLGLSFLHVGASLPALSLPHQRERPIEIPQMPLVEPGFLW